MGEVGGTDKWVCAGRLCTGGNVDVFGGLVCGGVVRFGVVWGDRVNVPLA